MFIITFKIQPRKQGEGMKSQIHRCNCRNLWSIQNRKRKIIASSILLKGDWTAELKPERRGEPKGFVTTIQSENIIINPHGGVLEKFERISKLLYDKQKVNFNITQGRYLYFSEDGSCYILKKIKKVRGIGREDSFFVKAE